MLRGIHTIGTGDRRLYMVDYGDWVVDGSKLVTAAIAVVGPIQSVVDQQYFNAAHDKLLFYVQAGAIKEVFTARIQITDTLKRVTEDTVNFTVTPCL